MPGGDSVTPVRQQVIDRAEVGTLIHVLRDRGFEVVGPTVRDGAIVYDSIESIEELPAGWSDEQRPAHYRLVRREDGRLFGFNVGPHSWKRFLFPPSLTLWRARRGSQRTDIEAVEAPAPRLALFGARGCELHAMRIQDRVLLGDRTADPDYRRRRGNVFIVAVNCSQAGGTCFCASMGTGPAADSGFDLCLTELLRDGRHEVLVESGSPEGEEILSRLSRRDAPEEDVRDARRSVSAVAAAMGRELVTDDVHDLLLTNLEHPRWDDVADRCLGCANCTMVCPTCFCTTVDDATNLAGTEAERVRRWDSCFTMEHSYLHGGSVRKSTRSRYRQWLTHKLATWIDQFGTSGCVGCGRCVTWCPAGIDLTQEVAALRHVGPGPREATHGRA